MALGRCGSKTYPEKHGFRGTPFLSLRVVIQYPVVGLKTGKIETDPYEANLSIR